MFSDRCSRSCLQCHVHLQSRQGLHCAYLQVLRYSAWLKPRLFAPDSQYVRPESLCSPEMPCAPSPHKTETWASETLPHYSTTRQHEEDQSASCVGQANCGNCRCERLWRPTCDASRFCSPACTISLQLPPFPIINTRQLGACLLPFQRREMHLTQSST